MTRGIISNLTLYSDPELTNLIVPTTAYVSHIKIYINVTDSLNFRDYTLETKEGDTGGTWGVDTFSDAPPISGGTLHLDTTCNVVITDPTGSMGFDTSGLPEWNALAADFGTYGEIVGILTVVTDIGIATLCIGLTS